jgi:hypothetical protein
MTEHVDSSCETAFRLVFPDYVGPVHRGLDASQVPGWDSLKHADLIMVLEEARNQTIDPMEAFECATLGELMDMFDKATGHE